MTDDRSWADMVDACTDKGVTERPPVPGFEYKAFGVYAPGCLSRLLGFAIAHRDGDTRVVDVVKGDISIRDAADICKRYAIARVVGADGDEADALAHAVAGVINELG